MIRSKPIYLWAVLTEKVYEICLIFTNMHVTFIALYKICVIHFQLKTIIFITDSIASIYDTKKKKSTKVYGIKHAIVMKITVSGITLPAIKTRWLDHLVYNHSSEYFTWAFRSPYAA